MALYGVDLNITVKKIIMDLKLSLTKYGGINIKNLKRLFKEFDYNGNGKLEKYEFQQALAKFGFFPKTQDLTALQKYFDLDKDGAISYQEFMIALREPLNEQRYKLISKVFFIFDKQKTGQLNLQQLCDVFDVSKDLYYVRGQKSKDQLVKEFANSFDLQGDEQTITFDNFLQYYEDLSLSIPSDSAFVYLVSNTWGITEDDEKNISQEEVKSIVKNLRQKLIQITQGNHDEFILRKLFNDFNVSQSGYMTIEELDAMLAKLDFPMQKKYLLSLFRKFDSNNSGYIEFSEFCQYVLHNPYP